MDVVALSISIGISIGVAVSVDILHHPSQLEGLVGQGGLS